MNKTRFTPVYNRKKTLNKQGKALIQIECYLNGKNKYFSTNIYIEPTFWNDKNRTIKLSFPNAIKLNKQIAEKIRMFENFELDKLNAGKPFNLTMLSDLNTGKVVKSFTDFMAIEIENQDISEETKKNHRSTLKRLLMFRKVVYFEDVTFEFLHDFNVYLLKVKVEYKNLPPKKLAQNTIWKYFKNIKTYVNLAINKDLISINDYPFRKFKAKQEEVTKIFLTPDEIVRFESLDLKKDSELNEDLEKYQFVKDLFLFSVYTGLRFGDVMSLQKKELIHIEGNMWLVKKMGKTNENVRIPIYTIFNGKPIEIINKYNNLKSFLCFEQVTNQYVNRVLKILAKKAGIDKLVTFHSARHTTATFLLYKGVNITTVQKVLGHKKVATTQIYGHIMDKTILNDIKAVNF